jgi:hypothetical protein
VTESRLSPLQRDLLEAFFARSSDFHLTGGAALAGFYLGHRTTEDLDLFTPHERLEEGVLALKEAASSLGASLEGVRLRPTFRRYLVRRGNESVLVDLVHDPLPQGRADKPLHGRIRVDPPAEILANKLCALLSRSEIRDLVDVLELERSGCDLTEAVGLAQRKDGGLTPAQLGFVLGEMKIGDDARVPGRRSTREVRAYLEDLVARLARMASPR